MAFAFVFSCSACSKKAPVVSAPDDSSATENMTDETAAESTDTVTEPTETQTDISATTTSAAAASKTTTETKKQATTAKTTKATAAQISPYQLYHNAYSKLKALTSVDMNYNTSTSYGNSMIPSYSDSHHKKQVINASNPSMYDSETVTNNSNIFGSSDNSQIYCYLNGKGYIFDDNGGTGSNASYNDFLKKIQSILPLSNEMTTERLTESDFSGAAVTKAKDGTTTIKLNLTPERAQSLYKAEANANINKSFTFYDYSFSAATCTIMITSGGYLKEYSEKFTTKSSNQDKNILVASIYNNPGKPVTIDFPYAHY